MDEKIIYDDLRQQFGPVSVLYSEQIAVVLGKSPAAVLALISRNGLPIPVLEVGGRPAVAVRAVAKWLASAGKVKEEGPTPAGAPAVAAPKRKQHKFGGSLIALRLQINFLSELHNEIENMILRDEIEKPDIDNGDLGRGDGP